VSLVPRDISVYYSKLESEVLFQGDITPVKSFASKVESKRCEMFLILGDYFACKNLQQSVPNISDR